MATQSTLAIRVGNAARWRVAGLLAFVVCAAAFGRDSDGGGGGDRDRSRGSSAPLTGDSAAARAYVDAHNAVRAAVREPAGYAGPPWAPIPPVAWSDEVAISAQAWADHLRDDKECKLEHSDTRYGENLAAGKDVDAAQAVQMWASEGGHYAYTPRYEFVIVTAHYTQVVWRKTTFIGCGRASCGRRAVVVCQYSPPGNYIDRAPF
jgi:uncharacterized protein YkwD